MFLRVMIILSFDFLGTEWAFAKVGINWHIRDPTRMHSSEAVGPLCGLPAVTVESVGSLIDEKKLRGSALVDDK